MCSSVGTLHEVAGDAAVFFNPLSVEDIAEKMAEVALSAQRQDVLRQAGFENVKRFSWAQTAATTLSVYRDAGASGR